MRTATAAALAGLAPHRAAATRRVVVVGGGIGGLTLAWVLARAGHAVTVIDAARLPNPRGSSTDEGRIIRHSYGTMEGYAAMMPAAHRAWAALFVDTGTVRLLPARSIYILRALDAWQAAVERSLAAIGFGLSVLDEASLAALPMINRDGVLRVVAVEGSGILPAGAILTDLLALLTRVGVTLRQGEAVAEVDPDRAVVTLASGGALEADIVVVAAGARAESLLPEVAHVAGLRASVQTLAYLEPPDALRAAWASGPILHARLPGHAAGGLYVLPPRDGSRLKLGDYETTTDADLRRDHASLRADRAAALLDAGARVIAGFGAYRVAELRHCHYTMAPEDRFVVTRAGKRGWLLSACSGHGFKLAPLIALGLAAAIEERLGDDALAAWAGGRVAEDADA